MGGAVGEQGIADMFKQSYDHLYNSSPSAAEMADLKTRLEDMIGLSAREEVVKVTGAAQRRYQPHSDSIGLQQSI